MDFSLPVSRGADGFATAEESLVDKLFSAVANGTLFKELYPNIYDTTPLDNLQALLHYFADATGAGELLFHLGLILALVGVEL